MSTSLMPDQVAQAQVRASHHNYLQRVLTGVDDFVNVATGGNLDETISARAQRLSAQGNEFAKLLNFGLGEIQKKHGLLANAGDLERAEEEEKRAKAALGESPATQT